ncbi:hypothetical protein BY458DRAFT_305735 [Sporodiniella umbellata]|nr:hypothetical protein BY458DRAFT_305735 [Sporodiniella umbellata]
MNYPQNFNHNSENSVLPDNQYPSYTLLADNRQGFGLSTTTMHEPRDTALSEVWNLNSTVTPRGSPRGIAGFVAKLYQCLQSPQNEPKYARWCKHQGRDMFIIERIPEFTEAVLPRLFKHSKFPSFVRQLNVRKQRRIYFYSYTIVYLF